MSDRDSFHEHPDEQLSGWQRAERPTFVRVPEPNGEFTTWPVDGHDMSVEWKLRYANDHVSREDMLFAASVMAAYRAICCGRTLGDSMTKMRRGRRAHMEVFP